MKRFFIFFAVGLFISNAIIAQTIQHKADTISAALFHRIETHTLSKNDSAFLKQKLGEVLMVKNGDNVNFGLIIKLANHK